LFAVTNVHTNINQECPLTLKVTQSLPVTWEVSDAGGVQTIETTFI